MKQMMQELIYLLRQEVADIWFNLKDTFSRGEQVMCYRRCPFENSYTGECQSPKKNSMSPSAYCHEGEEVEEELEE